MAVALSCTFALVWKVTLGLAESELSSPCGEQICLTHCIQWYNLICKLSISGESRLDVSSFKRLKTEVGVLQ